MSSAHCYFCGELTDGENMFQLGNLGIGIDDSVTSADEVQKAIIKQ